MTESFDPRLALQGLLDGVASDKMPLALFVGAGCSKSLKNEEGSDLLPDMVGLSSLIASLANEKKNADSIGKTYRSLAACCAGQEIIQGVQTFTDAENGILNVESALSRIRSIKEFIGDNEFAGMERLELEKLEVFITTQIVEAVDKVLPKEDCPFDEMARLALNKPNVPVEVFTTNYDTLIEQAFERNEIAYFDGFVGSAEPFFDLRAIEEDKLPHRWARVWKMHGSINWSLHPQTQNIVRVRSDNAAVIHPSNLKYDQSRRLPYLALVDRLKSFLRHDGQPCMMLICGYSFGDQHLNEAIQDSLGTNPRSAAFALMFGESKNYPEAVSLSKKRKNLILMCSDGMFEGGGVKQWPSEAVDDFWQDAFEKNSGGDALKFLLGNFQSMTAFLARRASGQTFSVVSDD